MLEIYLYLICRLAKEWNFSLAKSKTASVFSTLSTICVNRVKFKGQIDIEDKLKSVGVVESGKTFPCEKNKKEM